MAIKNAGRKSAIRAFGLHFNEKRQTDRNSLKLLYLADTYVLLRKDKHNKKPTIVEGFTAFLLPAYLKRTEYIDMCLLYQYNFLFIIAS
ncbi:MAG TPA: hypothetical protein DIW47_06960 [Bacteroidetes bacterium]|nr:hypothetical protein [Bacteroidota bacterium]